MSWENKSWCEFWQNVKNLKQEKKSTLNYKHLHYIQ